MALVVEFVFANEIAQRQGVENRILSNPGFLETAERLLDEEDIGGGGRRWREEER